MIADIAQYGYNAVHVGITPGEVKGETYGDFLDETGNIQDAIKQYLIAKNHVNRETYDENMPIIDARLNDIKMKIGKDKYLNIIKEIKNNGK